MNKKFELTNITMEYNGRILYRIKALKDFADVKKGDLGGWVQYEENLSQQGNCWIYDDAKCMDNSRMYDNSCMHNYSKMYDYSEMHDYSKMYDYSEMYECSKIYDYSEMHDYSKMHDCSEMHDYSEMYECSKMYWYSKMHGYSIIYNSGEMCDYSEMFENSEMYGNSKLKDKEKLYGTLVSKVDAFIEIHNNNGRIVTGVLKNDKILFNVGYQEEITKEEFIDRIYYEDGGIEENPHRKEYLKIIDMIEMYFSYED